MTHRWRRRTRARCDHERAVVRGLRRRCRSSWLPWTLYARNQSRLRGKGSHIWGSPCFYTTHAGVTVAVYRGRERGKDREHAGQTIVGHCTLVPRALWPFGSRLPASRLSDLVAGLIVSLVPAVPPHEPTADSRSVRRAAVPHVVASSRCPAGRNRRPMLIPAARRTKSGRCSSCPSQFRCASPFGTTFDLAKSVSPNDYHTTSPLLRTCHGDNRDKNRDKCDSARDVE